MKKVMGWFRFSKNTKVEITYLWWLWENLTGSSKLLTITTWSKIFNVLIDAGSRQWWLDQDEFNANMPIDPTSLHAIILTHAHMDHIGKIPLYFRNWFTWPIYTTPITKPLIFEALKDEQKIFQRILEEKKEILTKLKKAFNVVKRHQASNFEWWAKIKKMWEQKTEEIKKKYSNSINMLQKNKIHSLDDIKKFESTIQTMEDEKVSSELDLFAVMRLVRTAPYNKTFHIVPRVASAKFYNAWHIEWSAQVDIEVAQKNLLFSGDLGRIRDNLVVWKPIIPKKNKYSFLSLESTYAGKIHPDRFDANNELFDEIANTHWPILLPCFSLQRIPEILLTLLKGKEQLNETEESIYGKRANKKWFELKNIVDSEIIQENIRIKKEWPKWATNRDIDTIYVDSPLGKKYKEIFMKELWTKYKNINTNKIKFITLAERENLIGKIKKWHRILILSSSGMLQWGTVMHYLPEILKQHKAKIIFTWYAWPNTLAWQINGGNKIIAIKWERHEVFCANKYIQWFSSHADHDELIDYFKSIPKARWSKVVLEHWWETREILAWDMINSSSKILIPQEWDKIRLL